MIEEIVTIVRPQNPGGLREAEAGRVLTQTGYWTPVGHRCPAISKSVDL